MNKIFNKKIIFLGAAIMIVLLASCLTVVTLKVTLKKKSITNQPSRPVKESTEIIRKFNLNLANNLVEKGYNRQTNLDAALSYKMDGHEFELIFDSNNSILLSTDKASTSNVGVIKDRVAGIMKENNLSMTNYALLSPNKDLEYSTFIGDNTVCQFSNTKLVNSTKSMYYDLVCLDKKVMQDKYAQINKLLAIYKKSGNQANFSQAAIRTGSKDNLAYAIIDLNSNKNRQKLLFGATKNSWEYLGDLLSGGKQYSNGKYSITPELKKKIEGSGYGKLISTVLLKG